MSATFQAYRFDVGQFLVIFKEEGEVLIGHIHFSVSSKPSVFLDCITSTRESVLFDLRENVAITVEDVTYK